MRLRRGFPAFLIISLMTIILVRYLSFEKRYQAYYSCIDAVTSDCGLGQYSQGKVYVSGKGHVYYKCYKNDVYQYYLKDVTLLAGKYKLSGLSIILYLEDDRIPQYSEISFKGQLSQFNIAMNEGSFDAKNYYESLGIICAVKKGSAQTIDGSGSGFGLVEKDFIYRIRQSLKLFYEYALSAEEAQIMGAIAIGTKEDLTVDVKDLFKRAGLMHIMAISGLHISVVGMGIYKLLRKRLHISFLFSALWSGVLLVFYAVLCGNSVSCVRAVGMFIIYLLAEVLGRSYNMGRAWIFMGLCQLIYNPFLIHNSSFVFSYGAVAGIFLIAIPMKKRYDEFAYIRQEKLVSVYGLPVLHSKPWWLKVVDSFASSFLFSLCASLATMGIVAYYYYEVPVASFFLNIFILPLMPFLLGLGLVGALVGQVWFAVGKVLLFPCHLIIYLMEISADGYGALPISTFITGCPKWWQLVLYYMVLIGIVHGNKWLENEKHENSQSRELVIKMILMSLSFLIILLPTRNTFRIDFLSVGQGDGIHISDGRGCNIMIDGGSTSNTSLGEYVISPFLKYNGIRKVDYWFVSHCDEDHVSGLIYMAENGYKIGGVYMSENVLKDEAYFKLIDVLKRCDIPVHYMKVGDKLINKEFEMECVYPTIDAARILGNDANARSMVIRLVDSRRGFSALFVGDMNEQAERLMVNEKRVQQSDLLKVGHHGSKYSSSADFLNVVRPKTAIISYGRNTYGHPHKETLDRLADIDAIVHKTMEEGQITVKGNKINNNCIVIIK